MFIRQDSAARRGGAGWGGAGWGRAGVETLCLLRPPAVAATPQTRRAFQETQSLFVYVRMISQTFAGVRRHNGRDEALLKDAEFLGARAAGASGSAAKAFLFQDEMNNQGGF